MVLVTPTKVGVHVFPPPGTASPSLGSGIRCGAVLPLHRRVFAMAVATAQFLGPLQFLRLLGVQRPLRTPGRLLHLSTLGKFLLSSIELPRRSAISLTLVLAWLFVP